MNVNVNVPVHGEDEKGLSMRCEVCSMAWPAWFDSSWMSGSGERLRRSLSPSEGRDAMAGTIESSSRLYCGGGGQGSPGVTCPQSLVRGKTVFNRFDRWAKRGKWKRLFEALQTDRDDEWHSLDSTVNRAHQHAAGAKGGKLGRHLVVLVVGCQPKCTWSWMLWGCR